MRAFWSGVSTILWKDILAELRAKEIVLSVLVFVILILVIFNFAFRPGPDLATTVGPGVLWVAFTFAGVLGMNRTFVLEKDRGCLEGLTLSPVPREAIQALLDGKPAQFRTDAPSQGCNVKWK